MLLSAHRHCSVPSCSRYQRCLMPATGSLATGRSLLFRLLIQLLLVLLQYPIRFAMRGKETDIMDLRPASLIASEGSHELTDRVSNRWSLECGHLCDSLYLYPLSDLWLPRRVPRTSCTRYLGGLSAKVRRSSPKGMTSAVCRPRASLHTLEPCETAITA